VKRTGVAAASRAAGILREHLGRLTRIEKKGKNDLVTEADTAAEAAIIATIRSRFPDHDILAEESGATGGGAECRWIIDPLDGTTNFAHGLEPFAVSIAFEAGGETRFGLVLNPASGELFSAIQGRGASLNGEPIGVSPTPLVADSLLVTGFPYDFREILPEVTHRLTRCLIAAQGIRRLGSAAVDLCYVACGRFDGFWEQNLKPWDTAAGVLIAREAGARVTDFAGHPFTNREPEILATNGRIHIDMLALLALQEGK